MASNGHRLLRRRTWRTDRGTWSTNLADCARSFPSWHAAFVPFPASTYLQLVHYLCDNLSFLYLDAHPNELLLPIS